MMTIIAAIIGGLIIGALARLILPGRQNISILMTILIGILGSFAGSFITRQFGYSNSNGGFEILPFVVGVAVAAGLIVLYGMIVGKRS